MDIPSTLDSMKKPYLYVSGIIFLCFLLTSTGYLAWTYHLAGQIRPGVLELLTMVGGYLAQALGIAVFYVLLKNHPGAAKYTVYISLLVHMITLVPAAVSEQPAGTIVFGLLMNTACGLIAGYYLYFMTKTVSVEKRASSFGLGYGLSILMSWLLSSVCGGTAYYSGTAMIICAVLSILSFLAIRLDLPDYGAAEEKALIGEKDSGAEPAAACPSHKNILVYAAVLVFLFGLLNSSGFSFPSSDIGGAVNVEFSRLVYAAGLIIAGYVTDRSRRYGATAALTVLVIPFVLLALNGESVPAIIFWALSYFTFGFYSVYRVILFSDMASERGILHLAGIGLMIGRIGEAAGEGICLALREHVIVLVVLTALLFAVTVILFFFIYQELYVSRAEQQNERAHFEQFALKHDLSVREREVLRQIFEGKTNAEIAEALFISENTVKFHVRNLLQKTGCRNRKELYSAFFND